MTRRAPDGPPARPRVGIVLDTYEHRSGTAGGFVHLMQSVKHWRSFEATVFGPEIARDAVMRELPAARFVAVPSPDRWTASMAIVFLARMIGALATAVPALRRCDAVYAFSHFLPDVAPAVCAAPRRTVVQVFHLQAPPGKRPGSLARNMLAYANEALGMMLVRAFARSVVVLNDTTVPQFRLPARTAVFRCGAGAWPFPVRSLVVPVADRRDVVCVGRVHPTKGIEDLLAAWALVRARVPGAVLHVIGTGEPAYIASLRARLEQSGLESSVRMPGFVDDAAKARLLAGARVFATASREEGWGIAVAEALALGVPCVTYDLPAFREAFPRGRYEVRVGDVDGFARGIVELLVDDARCASLAAQALELGETFSWEEVARVEERAIASVRPKPSAPEPAEHRS